MRAERGLRASDTAGRGTKFPGESLSRMCWFPAGNDCLLVVMICFVKRERLILFFAFDIVDDLQYRFANSFL